MGLSVAVPIPDRCVEPGCGVVLVSRRSGLRTSELPPGHGLHDSHGLCHRCRLEARRRGKVNHYPRRTRSADEILEIWQALRRPRFDYSLTQAAAVIGVTPYALERALSRARKTGDPRAVPGRAVRFQPSRPCREGGARGWARWDVFDTCTADEGEETA